MELFPQIIKDYPQWAICGFYAGTPSEKQPYVWDNEEGKLVPLRKKGTVHGEANLNLLMSYEDAVRCVKYYNQAGHSLNIGFYLMPSDPFCCVDMDLKDTWDDQQKQEAGARYAKIVETFGSYTEISKSGNGLHMWIYGIPQEGRRRDGVEVYSQYRFIICTGNHWNISPLTVAGASGSATEAHVANMLHLLLSEMTAINKSDDFEMREYTQEEFDADPYAVQDQDIYIQLCEQENGNLFKQLWEGRWDVNEVDHTTGERGFASQSEAEFALIDFLCFKTKYNFQVRRLFMYSKMGDRYDDMRRTPGDKIKKPYHLERMIRSYRYDSHIKSLSVKAIVESNIAYALETTEKLRQQTTPEMAPVEVKTSDGEYTEEFTTDIDWPPGFVGEVARSMFKASLYPVKDIAILSSLALFSGLCGKAWNTETDSGLNNYFCLVALSGSGKESFRKNIESVLDQVALYGGSNGEQILGVSSVLSTENFASAPALHKTLISDGSIGSLSIVNYRTEAGDLFCNAKNEVSKDKGILNLMLSLYESGYFRQTLGSVRHSAKENTVEGGKCIAYTFAGETTPDSFYANIDEQMLGDGTMSRFIIWDCAAPRPLMNVGRCKVYSDGILKTIGKIYKQAVTICSSDQCCEVELGEEASRAYLKLDIETRTVLNEGKDGKPIETNMIRQLYNRKDLKILRIASLLAVADNCIKPVVNIEHFSWAENFINLANKKLMDRYNSGELGTSTSQDRERAVADIILKILQGTINSGDPKYKGLRDYNIITKSDISTHCRQRSAFKKAKRDDIVSLIKLALDGLQSMDIIDNLTPQTYNELVGGDKMPGRQCYIVDKKKLKKFINGS